MADKLMDQAAGSLPHVRFVFSIPILDEHVLALQSGLTLAGFEVHLLREEWGEEAYRAIRIYERSGTALKHVEICEWFANCEWKKSLPLPPKFRALCEHPERVMHPSGKYSTCSECRREGVLRSMAKDLPPGEA